jgi:hypothetical protein
MYDVRPRDTGMGLVRKVKGEESGHEVNLRAADTGRQALEHVPMVSAVILRTKGGCGEGKLSQAKATRTAQLVDELEQLAQRCGIEVRHERLLREIGYRARSGSCKVKEKNLVILDRTLAPAEQVEILADALRAQDLESLYLSPAARRLLQEERG